MIFKAIPLIVVLLLCQVPSASGQQVLVEAEGFDVHGGWKLDTQFIQNMGSPFLLAHGLGKPVQDATTTVEFPEVGEYRVFVRTRDWVARWKAPGTPGRFELLVDGKPLEQTFGTESADWFWQDGGTVQIDVKNTQIALHDLTGFDGRCDAILFTKDNQPPSNSSEILPAWRRTLLGLDDTPAELNGYDLVVVGGGYSGMGTALSAARMGCRVALIQNRSVLGGNGSSEVRVWAMGLIRRGRYPRIGEIIEEFCDRAKKSPGTYQEFGDDEKEAIIRAEPNIDLFLNHHAFDVETKDSRITAVHACDTRTGAVRRISGRLFTDCTGHGTIGFLAKAEWEMTHAGRMGMSNMWAWDEGEENASFPETPWALDLEMKDFPYPRDHHGQWFWESGFDKNALTEAEEIRDWNFRAVYGAFNAMKNRGGAEKHKTAFLTWLAYIGGPRESRRLLGDVVLTQDNIVSKHHFPDGCVASTWSIDLHYPKKQFAEKFPENPFISVAVHDRRIDRSYGYPVPYRCFYSRNIDNLFMAGRCISVTHQALGTTRVMKTCGMMGEVVGRAASICIQQDCSPRDVYSQHWGEMTKLLTLPGKARRLTVNDEIVIPDDVMELAGPDGPVTGLNPKKMEGLVIDNKQAVISGSWTSGAGLRGYVGWEYLYASADSGATIRFDVKAPLNGRFDIRLAYQSHENRGSAVPVSVQTQSGTEEIRVNMKKSPPLNDAFISLGQFDLSKGEPLSVTVSTEKANGFVHADAVQIVRVEK